VTWSAVWQWFVTPGGLATILVGAVLVSAATWARRWVVNAYWAMREGHVARMRRKYGPPPLGAFLHPAVFEVQGRQRAGERALFLVNIGKGDAFAVVLGDTPWSYVRVRGERSWDQILAGGSVRIDLEGEFMAALGPGSVMVSWTDAMRGEHEHEAALDDGAQRVLGKLF